ncbi:MAG: hypothetical protein WDZ51_13340 [Pirellulaceae bacterium]
MTTALGDNHALLGDIDDKSPLPEAPPAVSCRTSIRADIAFLGKTFEAPDSSVMNVDERIPKGDRLRGVRCR